MIKTIYVYNNSKTMLVGENTLDHLILCMK